MPPNAIREQKWVAAGEGNTINRAVIRLRERGLRVSAVLADLGVAFDDPGSDAGLEFPGDRCDENFYASLIPVTKVNTDNGCWTLGK